MCAVNILPVFALSGFEGPGLLVWEDLQRNLTVQCTITKQTPDDQHEVLTPQNLPPAQPMSSPVPTKVTDVLPLEVIASFPGIFGQTLEVEEVSELRCQSLSPSRPPHRISGLNRRPPKPGFEVTMTQTEPGELSPPESELVGL
ncbi:hypothetical protein P7K49_006016 [Saguinus oedipus]|uniref:Uncharacterized protein n=1 Tax=Saguinus oedipus TaxID=9490 RepID=A0ABQ9W1Q6_SAGOE|nr:hypothetical protein P7K49_006016 [Saguinus oedipus]